MMQKGIGPNIYDDQPAVLQQLQVMNGFDRRLGLTLPGPEGTEIMCSHERRRSGTHTLDIEWAMVPGNLFGHVRRPYLIVVDHIAITASHRAEARIEMTRHLLRPGD